MKRNTDPTQREATFTLSATDGSETTDITLTQAAARQLSADKSNIPVTADAGRATFNVTANVPWRITQASPVSWISSISPPTGRDNQQITIVYDENTATTSREAILTLEATGAGATETLRITLTQEDAARQLSADKSNIPVTAAAGRVTFNVTANVPWGITQVSPVTWISSISPPTGRDNQRITITYEENTAPTNREAILTLKATESGATETLRITLTQAGARVLLASPSSLTPTAAAGSITFDVSANVPWKITNSDTWITSISHSSGRDNQQITIVYEENTDPTQREATFTLSATDGSETTDITLTQAAAARQLSADKSNIPVTADAGRATFNVTANVPWRITQASPVSWISSISPPTGRDNQQITIVYDENTATTSREAILTLEATGAGATETLRITLTQEDAARQLSADKTRIPVTAVAGNVTFNVTANVPWEITNSDTWITSISHSSGRDNQRIAIVYEENTDPTQREATFTLSATDGSETTDITLTQAGARVLLASPSSLTPTADAGSITFDVSANVPWEITQPSPVPWITDITPFRGRDNQQITIQYNENNTSASRDATLTLAATDGGTESIDITITQVVTTPPAVVGLPTLAKNLRFYPNPASQTLYIEGITQETSLIIRTFSGKTLLHATLSQNEAVDIASLPQGVYLLTLQSSQENAQEQITRRLVVGF